MPQGDVSEVLSAPLFESFPKETSIENGYLFDFGERVYRVLDMNLQGLSKLKVNLRASAGERFHVDTLDLYIERARERFAQVTAKRFSQGNKSADEETITQELYTLVEKLEQKRGELLEKPGASA